MNNIIMFLNMLFLSTTGKMLVIIVLLTILHILLLKIIREIYVKSIVKSYNKEPEENNKEKIKERVKEIEEISKRIVQKNKNFGIVAKMSEDTTEYVSEVLLTYLNNVYFDNVILNTYNNQAVHYKEKIDINEFKYIFLNSIFSNESENKKELVDMPEIEKLKWENFKQIIRSIKNQNDIIIFEFYKINCDDNNKVAILQCENEDSAIRNLIEVKKIRIDRPEILKDFIEKIKITLNNGVDLQ